MKNKHKIILKKVAVHNLKEIDIELNTNEFIVFTGVSGSGKSSLAFDTIFVEGQRRYIESLSTYARRYLGDLAKPNVEYVAGLSPTISIEQKSAGKNPRSTVGTMTEIYDYLRVLYARVGTPHCPVSGEPVAPQSKERIIKTIQNMPSGTRLILLAHFAHGKKGEFKDDFNHFLRKGYSRVRLDGNFVDLSEEISLDKNLAHDIDVVLDRLTVQPDSSSRIAEAIVSGIEIGHGTITALNVDTGEEVLFSTHGYAPKSGLSYSSLEPHDFSFNSPAGMCPTCYGLGRTQEFDLALIIDPEKSISEDCCLIASSYKTVRFGNIYDNLARIYHFDVNTPWKNLSEKAKKIFLYGADKKWIPMQFVHPTRPIAWTDYVQWRGVLHEARQRYAEAKSERYRTRIETLMHDQVCPECHGSRLKPYPSATKFNGKKIHELTSMNITEILAFFQKLQLDPSEQIIADELLKEIRARLQFLIDVGLHYLTLERTAPTLSGGESQRVRLASQVGCGLVGVTYVLDEPSIGLHPRDNQRLIQTLKFLRDLGNTVIVVEHDEETIWQADRIVDFGPGPGQFGGEILVNGTIQDLLASKKSITGAYLSGRKTIPVPLERRKAQKDKIQIKGAQHNNLKNINVNFPLGVMIAITGVSGSGKSSLITDTLYPALSNHLHQSELVVGKMHKITGLDKINKVIAIDQSPIGRSPRSNTATYIKLFDEIRVLFSQIPESKAKGYSPGRFSFNVRDGSCPQCHGIGMVRIDMDFMEDQWVPCTVCKAKRFDHETLSVYYKGKNIFDVLEMTVKEALDFFSAIPSLKKKLEVVDQVGMGYIKLGQPSTTLSGGEAQRIKLAKELVRPPTGKTLYILDEPTTGLHIHDIQALLSVLNVLTDRGNTMIIIEHNMEVVKTADWIIELGPEGGDAGGQIIAEGTPEDIVKLKTPTAAALRDSLRIHKPDFKPVHEPIPEVAAISVQGAAQNNLKYLDLSIPRSQLTVCCGPSGSGKSSFAFDTVYAEGQRRYVESLTPYARQFVKQMPKPKLSQIDGLSPAIAIEQKITTGNPRSTIGTMTEIYDYLRILFARMGTAYSPETGEEIKSITKDDVIQQIIKNFSDGKITILAPFEIEKQEHFEDVVNRFRRLGYLRLRLNQMIYELDGEIPFDRRRKNDLALVIDRLIVSKNSTARIYEAIDNAIKLSNNKVLIHDGHEDVLYNLDFAVQSTGKSYPPITPQMFSFNSPEGMCIDCHGLGYQYGADLARNVDMMELSILDFLEALWTAPDFPLFEKFLKQEKIDPATPIGQLTTNQLQLFLNGAAEDKWIETKGGLRFRWLGIQPVFAKIAKIAHHEIREPILPLMEEILCYSCHGSRLNPLASHVRIRNHTIASLCRLPISELLKFLEQLHVHPILEEVLSQLLQRLSFLVEVGLDYLSLDRRAPTLSNGETQRIRLARQLGSHLTGVLYVLDEPTIGLHPHDNARLNKALKKLKELGNTLLIVEHDPLTVMMADFILDFGPGAGEQGGHLIAQGTIPQILKNKESLTGAYLSGRAAIEIPKNRRQPKSYFSINKAHTHNLKHISVDIPIGVITCLTGVSGSGKSTLLHDEIKPAVEAILKQEDPFNKLIMIDQNPIGQTVRSDVGTYVEVLPILRQFYSSLGMARVKGLQPKHFSYNHKKGMCTQCWGLGYKKVEMLFLPAVKVKCDQCHGLRLNPLSLEVTYQNKNFGELLEMTVQEARDFFQILPKVVRILDTLISVGLGYLKLGQEMATLSGGEAQRIKLSRELARRSTGKTLYLLDEPTTGLHPDDVKKLLAVLHRLVDKGNTMVIIEHNTDLIKTVDYIIDLGPGAGEKGGEIVVSGTPEEVVLNSKSLTGKYLKKLAHV